MRKSRTGIPGFDKLVEGGFPVGSTILICGTPGTAKSIFCMQYIINGAMSKEKSLYVSFEQSRGDLIKQNRQFGADIEALEKTNMLHLITIPVRDIDDKTFGVITEYVEKHKIKRLVIDSLSTLSINAPMYAAISGLYMRDLVMQDTVFSPSLSADFLLKRFIYLMMGELQQMPVTTLLISEIGNDSKFYSRDTISEFLCDGIIQMFFESMGGEYSRSLLVRKMRHVNNDEDIHPVEIGKKGIVVHDLK